MLRDEWKDNVFREDVEFHDVVDTLAFVSLVKYGAWTAVAVNYFFGAYFPAPWAYFGILFTHLVMVGEAFLLPYYARTSKPALAVALAWLLVNDVADYWFGLAPRLRPMLALRLSPLGSAGVVVSGITGAAFRMVGPVYGLQVGLRADEIALWLAAYVIGGAAAQWPVGWLADRYDRRWVLIGISVAGVASCALTVALAGAGTAAVFVGAIAFGFATLPVYSISTAHAHDFASSAERVELSAALMFLYAIGAIASPVVSSALIAGYGPEALFLMIAAAHVALIVFGIVRMRARPAPEDRTAYVYAPRTSFTIGRLLGRLRERR